MAALIRTLAFQIAQQLPSFRKSLNELADSGYKPKDAEWRWTWKKLFVNLLFEMKSSPPLYWIIDGVDEANSPHYLFELLSDLHVSKIPVRVLVTTRWSQALVPAFERTSSRVPCFTISIDKDLTDMRIYVEEELKYNNWGSDIKEKVVRQVLDKSNDSFLWVHLMLDELQNCNTEDDIAERLLELPLGMDGLYRRMEENICQLRRASDKNLARQLLIWAIHTRRALASEELEDLLEPEFGRLLDISQTISRLCGYFIVMEGSDKIGLIHQTAREYLTATSTLLFFFSAATAHGELFEKSMASFLDKGLRSRLQRTSPKLLKYRATSWAFHLASTDLLGEGDFEKSDHQLDLLTQFFTKPPVLIWIQVLASLGELRVLIDASQAMYAFVRRKRKADAANDPVIRRFDELEVLEGWSRDLLKILGKFGGSLSREPDIIYTSIAPLCPITSSIYRTFAKQQSSSLQASNLPEDWDDCLARVSVGNECAANLISCSGRYIAVSSSKRTITVWDCITFQQVHELEHGEAVSAMCFSSKGDRLATYGLHHTKIWSSLAGKLLLSIHNHPDIPALCLKFVDNDTTIIMGSGRRCVLRCSLISEEPHVWKNIDPQLLNDVESHEGTYLNSPAALAISPDGSKIAVAYIGFPFSIWSIDQAIPLKRLTRPQKPGQQSNSLPFVFRVSWHPGGDEILGIFMDGYSFKLNVVDGSYQEQPPTPAQMPSNIICSPDGLVYAISGVSGIIRLFDYQSSTLIYQLNSDDLITDFCFSDDGRKLYDIRGSHCTIWGPNALMRLTTVDDDPAHSQGVDESIRQPQVASETFIDNSVPIVLMSPAPQGHLVGFGNGEGLVELFDYDTSERIHAGQTDSHMSIEYLVWSECGNRVCYSELGGRLTVVQLEQGSHNRRARRVERFKPKMDAEEINQILFLPGSKSLLASSASSVQYWSLEPAQVKMTLRFGPSLPTRKWISHPRSPYHLLSITPNSVSVYKQTNLEEVSIIDLETPRSSSDTLHLDQAQAGTIDTARIEEEVDTVTPTFMKGHVLVKISRTTSSRKLPPRFRIFDAGHLPVTTISPIDVPERISKMVEMLSMFSLPASWCF
ncbi:hypothetical protein G7Z17_g2299 [Cylindrodendrum hubeiense]|uniref:Uncharacterized protein n=1 Tax=Cylindrodendrum hubeiense TaxID=595255 RepID=A0A9P5LKI5_9HYPO|nr:hypothetical protein G7Z17_g2299 [Cylindrodendrum hubeiense]